MESTSREYAKFKRLFVGPKLTRKQRLALMPPMPAERPKREYKSYPINQTPSARQRKIWSAYQVKRRQKRDKSTPPWANKKVIKQLYAEARKLTLKTGIKHEVDHIIPSNHDLVCGLHVETNLQILTKQENCDKGNFFE